MVFTKLLGVFGDDGPSVETYVQTPYIHPGGTVTGQIRLLGGGVPAGIDQVAVSLVTRVEHEHGDAEGTAVHEFHRFAVAGGFGLGPHQHVEVPFALPLPWELPITHVYGQHLHGMTMGLYTELEIAGTWDRGDLDAIGVAPLPSQQRVLDAFAALGFPFKSADIEAGHISGVVQELPFYQEIEFYPSDTFAGALNEVELTFVTDPVHLTVIVEADVAEGSFSSGGDAIGRFTLTHEQALHHPWEHELTSWLHSVAAQPGYAPQPGYASHSGYASDPGYGGHDHGGGGPGWGGVAAGAVAGVAVGAVAGYAASELIGGDDDDDDDDDSGGDAFDITGDAVLATAAALQAEEEAMEAFFEDGDGEAVEDFEDAED